MPQRHAPKLRLTVGPSRVAVRVAVAAMFLLFGCRSLQDAVANGDTRTLSFQHTHRDDAITVTFKRNGRYDEDALKKLNWFLRDWRTDEVTRMDPQLFDILWEIHRSVGATQPIHVISSYRSPRTNAMLRRRSRGVAQFSQHMVGKAIDFFIPGVPLEQLRIAALRLQRGGVGFYPSSGSPFVHVDTGHVRHWPRMTYDQLARVFPDGKTVHIPSNGQPLRNYHLALAELERRGQSSSTRIAALNGEAQPQRPKRSFFEWLFGIGSEEDEDREIATASTPTVAATAPRPSEVPLPRARPGQGGEQALAFADPMAADAVRTRGVWRTDAAASRPPREEAGEKAEGGRLLWVTGPQGRIAAETVGTTKRSDRAGDLVLAYATDAASVITARAAPQPPAPMGAAGSPRAGTAGLVDLPIMGATVAPLRRGANPWLRGVLMAPTAYHSLHVAQLGVPDYRSLRPLMHKPRAVLAMSFSEDPYDGMISERFGGAAVAFLPTISFGGSRTAGLQGDYR